TDANQQVTRYVYDAANRRVFSIDALGAVEQTEYDAVGQVTRSTRYATPITLAQDRPTLNEVRARLQPNAGQDLSQRSLYDPAGRLTASIDRQGYLTEHRYDALGNRVSSVRYATPLAEATVSLATLQRNQASYSLPTSGVTAGKVSWQGGQLQLQSGQDTKDLTVQTQYVPVVPVDATHTAVITRELTLGTHAGRVLYVGTDNGAGWQTDGWIMLQARLMNDGTLLAEDCRGKQVTVTTLGKLREQATYLIEQEIAADRATLYVYEKGTARDSSTSFRYVQTATYQGAQSYIGQRQYQGSATTPPSTTTVAQWHIQQQLRYQAGAPYSANELRALVNATAEAASNGTTTGHQSVHQLYDAAGREVGTIDAAGYLTTRRLDGLGNVLDTTRYATPISSTALTPINLHHNKDRFLLPAASTANGKVSWQGDQLQLQSGPDTKDVSLQTHQLGMMRVDTAHSVNIYREITLGSHDGRYLHIGASNGEPWQTDAWNMLQVQIMANGAVMAEAYRGKQGTKTVIGQVRENATYIVEQELTAGRNLLYVYEKGTTRQGSATLKYEQTVPYSGALSYHVQLFFDGTATSKPSTTVINEWQIQQTVAFQPGAVLTAEDVQALIKPVIAHGQTAATTQQERRVYDAAGRLIASMDSLGVVTAKRYDSFGNVVETTRHATPLSSAVVASVDLRSNKDQFIVASRGAPTDQAVWNGDRIQLKTGPDTKHFAPYAESQRQPVDATHPVSIYREVTLGTHAGRYLHVGASNGEPWQTDSWMMLEVGISNDGTLIAEEYRGRQGKKTPLGKVKEQTTYIIEQELAADHATVYVYEKGSHRQAPGAFSHTQYAAYSGAWSYNTQMFFNGTASTPPSTTSISQWKTEWRATFQAGGSLDQTDLTALLKADSAQDRRARSLYDAQQRLRFSVDALGQVSERVYDAAGNVIQVTDYAQPVANSWTDETSLKALLKADAAQDRSRFTVYDQANRARYQLDALGYVTVNQYDSLGRLVGLTRHAKPIARPATL
uniref:RHS repeat domain-containing protein n=1 Tax=Chitinivorax sp. B TaxID=2502235 RepID=UPI0010F890BD